MLTASWYKRRTRPGLIAVTRRPAPLPWISKVLHCRGLKTADLIQVEALEDLEGEVVLICFIRRRGAAGFYPGPERRPGSAVIKQAPIFRPLVFGASLVPVSGGPPRYKHAKGGQEEDNRTLQTSQVHELTAKSVQSKTRLIPDHTLSVRP